VRLRHDTFWLLILISVGVVGCRSNPGTSTAVPATVTVAKPATQSVTEYLNFTGNTAASDSVTLVARVEGYLEKVHFKDGAPVKKRRSPVHHSAGSV
jgi:Membrane-fusion protein